MFIIFAIRFETENLSIFVEKFYILHENVHFGAFFFLLARENHFLSQKIQQLLMPVLMIHLSAL